ncbi:MAG: NifU family protein [Patescibacteria group bacterium]
MEQAVKRILAQIRPAIKSDGGNIQLVSVNKKTGVVRVRLTGACSGCPMAQITLKAGVEAALKKQVKGVKKVEAV